MTYLNQSFFEEVTRKWNNLLCGFGRDPKLLPVAWHAQDRRWQHEDMSPTT